MIMIWSVICDVMIAWWYDCPVPYWHDGILVWYHDGTMARLHNGTLYYVPAVLSGLLWSSCCHLFTISGYNFSKVLVGFAIFNPFLDATSHLYKSVCPSVRPSVCMYVRPYVTRFFLGTLRAVCAFPLLPNYMWLMLSCIRLPPMPLPTTLLPLPNPRDLCRAVYPALFLIRTRKPKMSLNRP